MMFVRFEIDSIYVTWQCIDGMNNGEEMSGLGRLESYDMMLEWHRSVIVNRTVVDKTSYNTPLQKGSADDPIVIL